MPRNKYNNIMYKERYIWYSTSQICPNTLLRFKYVQICPYDRNTGKYAQMSQIRANMRLGSKDAP